MFLSFPFFLLNLPMEYFNVIKVLDRWERSGLINTTNAVALARTHHWPTIVIFHKCVFYSRVAFNSTYILLQWRRTWLWSYVIAEVPWSVFDRKSETILGFDCSLLHIIEENAGKAAALN